MLDGARHMIAESSASFPSRRKAHHVPASKQSMCAECRRTCPHFNAEEPRCPSHVADAARGRHGDGTRRSAGRIHRLAFALGVLVALTVSANASAGAAANSARQTPISLPPTVSIGNGPTGLAYEGQTHTLYSVNQNSNSVSVVATKSCHAGDTKGCAEARRHSGPRVRCPSRRCRSRYIDRHALRGQRGDRHGLGRQRKNLQCIRSDWLRAGPPTVADPEGPGTGIAVNPLTDTIYVANAGSPYPSTAGHTVSVIDGATCNATTTSGCGQLPPTVTVGYQPVSVAVDQGYNTVYVADPGIAEHRQHGVGDRRGHLRRHNDLGVRPGPGVDHVGTAPFWITLDESTHTAYTANFGSASVSVIDIATCNATTTSGCGQKATTVPVGSLPWALTLDQSHHTLFVANNQDDTLSAINASTCNAVERSSCAERPPASQVGNGPDALVTDPSTGTVYSANFNAGTISVVNSGNCDATVTRGCRAEAPTIPVGSAPSGVAVDTATHTVYVANQGDNTVSVLDASRCSASEATGCASPSATVHVGDGPTGVAIDQATDSVYVANNGGDTVSVIDGATCNAAHQTGCAGHASTLTVGNGPFAIGINPTTDTIYVTDNGAVSIGTIHASTPPHWVTPSR